MGEFKGTPGSWHHQKGFQNVYALSGGDTGLTAHIAKANHEQVQGGFKEADANAQAIAAVPVLIEAAQAMAAYDDAMLKLSTQGRTDQDPPMIIFEGQVVELDDLYDQARDLARAALSKALGETGQ